MRHTGYRTQTRAPIWFGEGSPAAAVLGDEPVGAAFDFRTMQALVRAPGRSQFLGDVNDLLVNDAPSVKYVRNAAGVLVPGTTLRCDHVDGQPAGMLVESQRTRLSLYPTNLAHSAWGKANIALVPVDGAFKLITANGAIRGRIQQNAVGSETTRTVMMIAKAAEWKYAGLGFSNGAGVWRIAVFDLITGQWKNTTTYSTPGTIFTYGSWPLGDGYWALWVTADHGSSPCFMPAMAAGDAVNPTWRGDGISGILVSYAAVIDGSGPAASPILGNEALQVTRSADIISLLTSKLPFSNDGGTLIMHGMSVDYDTNGQTFGLHLNGSSTRYVRISKGDTGGRNARLGGTFRNSNQEAFELADRSFPTGSTPKKVGVSWDASGHVVASGVDGTFSESLATTMIFPASYSSLNFGAAAGAMWYLGAAYTPRKMTASEFLPKVMS